MRIKYLLMSFAFIALASNNLYAQENVKRAIDGFIDNVAIKQYIKTSVDIEKYGNATNASTYCKSYKFDLPEENNHIVNDIRDSFIKDTDSAYNVLIKDANSGNNNQMNIAYGKNLEKNVLFGTHKDRNYMIMLVRDQKDSLSRYCYAFVWYKNETRTCGSIYIIYGKDPQFVETKTLKNLNFNIKGTFIKNDSDFFEQFGTLRVAFMKYRYDINSEEGLYKMTALTNKIVEMVKTHKHLLNKDERTNVCFELANMQRQLSDKYLKGLLREAMTHLQK
ncbi:MAG: hypothetical protein ACI4V5_02450 [Prevotella sp.]